MTRLRASTLIPLAFFAVLAATLGLGLSRDPKVLPSMLLDRPIPSFDLLPLSSDNPHLATANFKGLTLINVFASWCASCRFEHPFLMRVANDKRFTLVGLDWKDTTPDANQYLQTFGNPYSQIGADESGRTGINLGVSGVPETFVVDSKGRVRLRVPGPMTPEIWKTEIEPLIQTAEQMP